MLKSLEGARGKRQHLAFSGCNDGLLTGFIPVFVINLGAIEITDC